ncbi:ABC-2 type transporter, partial [Teladorsagia circumcincta]
ILQPVSSFVLAEYKDRSSRTNAAQSPTLSVRGGYKAFVEKMVIAALTGIVYLGDSYTQDKVANINGSLYQLIMNMAFMFQFVVVNHFCSEISTFYREYSSGLYSVPAYFLAKNLAELPTYTLSAVIFGTILYWMSRLFPLWEAFGFYLLIAVLVQNTAISIAYAVGCVFGSVSTAVAILPIFVVPMMAFGGYFINQGSLPFYFYPFKYLSYFGYAFESLTVNEWSHAANDLEHWVAIEMGPMSSKV